MKAQAHTKRKFKIAVVSFVFAFATIFLAGELFAQGYPCSQYESCPSPGLSSIQAQMRRYEKLYERYNQRVDGRTADARSEEVYTQADDGCENCGTGVHGIKAAWFGQVDPRKTDAAKIKGDVDETVEKGVAKFVCRFPKGPPIETTMTAYQLDNDFSKGGTIKLIGAAHGLLSEKDAKKLMAQGKSEQQIFQLLDEDMKGRCKVVVTSRDGTAILETPKMTKYDIKTFYNERDPKNDILLIELKNSAYLQPVKLKKTTARELVGSRGKMIAYHHDITFTAKDASGKDQEYYPRVFSSGNFQPMHPQNPRSRMPGLVLHNLATNGSASGALIYNADGEGVAIHIGGINKDNEVAGRPSGEFDGYARYNIAIVLDDTTWTSVRDF